MGYALSPPTTGIPSAFSYKMFLPRQVMELWGCRQNLKNFNQQLPERIKEKAILPTVRGTPYAGVPCPGEKYNIHQVQGEKEVKTSLP